MSCVWRLGVAGPQLLRSSNLVGVRFFARDKTERILAYYPFAGYALRYAEVAR